MRQLATKLARRSPDPPSPDDYTWNEPKAKCILLGQPSRSLSNSRSPTPSFYHPKESNKCYLIITPYWSIEDESTHFVYKYDIDENKYIQFAKYPKECHINWPIHFIDHNKDILYIFDANLKGNKIFWKLNLINKSWTKNANIVIPHRHKFMPKSEETAICYDTDNKSVNIVYKSCGELFMDSFIFEDETIKTLKLNDCHFDDYAIPDGKYWKQFNFSDIAQYHCWCYPNTLILGFDHILFMIRLNDIAQHLILQHAEIWCLDLFNDENKWYKSDKQLPSYIDRSSHQYFIATNDGYLHFFHKYYYHTKISLFDVVPKELKEIHCDKFRKLTFGFIRSGIENKYNLNIPHYLKTLILCFHTLFHP